MCSDIVENILIIAGSPLTDVKWLKNVARDADLIICADGGFLHAQMADIMPHHLIGDFDSLSNEELQVAIDHPDITVHHEADQNSTDFQKALSLTTQYKDAQITITGALGGRLDQQLSNMLCLERYDHHNRIVLRDNETSVRLVSCPVVLQGKEGDIVGVVPLRETQNLRYEGLVYEAEGLGPPYQLGWLGTSNSMSADTARIIFDNGLVLVIHIDQES